MKKIILAALLLISAYSKAQLFEAQLAESNPAYTAMSDDRFADLSLSGLRFTRIFNFAYMRGSYQQNFANINSGFGVNFGHSRLNFEDFRLTTFHTSISYRYAHGFENGLRLSGGARLGYSRFDVSDNQQFGLADAESFHVQFGGMASYRNFTLGIAVPLFKDAFNSAVLNSSYRFKASERIELTALSNTYFRVDRFEQNFRLKSEFNQKFWLAIGLNIIDDRSIYNSYVSTGLHVGYRIKNNFHVMGGTDFGFSNKAFRIYNPQIGLVYQWSK